MYEETLLLGRRYIYEDKHSHIPQYQSVFILIAANDLVPSVPFGFALYTGRFLLRPFLVFRKKMKNASSCEFDRWVVETQLFASLVFIN